MAKTSPARRRLALLFSFTASFAVASLAPIPGARSYEQPRTAARTVPIPLESLAGSAGPTQLRTAGGTLRALAPAVTPPRAVCSSIWSTMVAFAWHQSGAGAVNTVVQDEGGNSASVIQDLDPDPDRGTPEYHPGLRTSPLYWTRGTRCVQLSLRLPAGVAVSDLRADFINTSGTAAGPGTGPQQPLASRALGVVGGIFGARSAQAMTSRPQLVTRDQWGAMKPRANCLGYADEIKMAYVHHTSGSNNYSPSQSDDIVRGIQYYHEHTRGYCDIAYNFLVDKYGTIYVGRYDSDNTSVNVIPGSQMGFNTYTFSVSAMGNYQMVQPSTATVQAIERVLAWRLDVAHLPPTGTATMTSSGGSTTRYRQGTTVTLPLISGHRQTGITDCPGNYLWNQLDAIRQGVSDLGRPKFFRPRQSRPTVTPLVDSDRFAATATDFLQWEVDIADADGNVVRSLYARGKSLSVMWDGTDNDGLPAPPGTYTATVGGATSDGAVARTAELPVAVNPEPVTPTPSP